jgi:hypothetical protein
MHSIYTFILHYAPVLLHNLGYRSGDHNQNEEFAVSIFTISHDQELGGIDSINYWLTTENRLSL